MIIRSGCSTPNKQPGRPVEAVPDWFLSRNANSGTAAAFVGATGGWPLLMPLGFLKRMRLLKDSRKALLDR